MATAINNVRNDIPSNVSDLTNDSGYLTTETDPTVPAWAKQASKPTYTAAEVGALPSSTAIPSKTSDLTNDSGYITVSAISGKADAATTLAGYGITDAYTKTQVDAIVGNIETLLTAI